MTIQRLAKFSLGASDSSVSIPSRQRSCRPKEAASQTEIVSSLRKIRRVVTVCVKTRQPTHEPLYHQLNIAT